MFSQSRSSGQHFKQGKAMTCCETVSNHQKKGALEEE